MRGDRFGEAQIVHVQPGITARVQGRHVQDQPPLIQQASLADADRQMNTVLIAAIEVDEGVRGAVGQILDDEVIDRVAEGLDTVLHGPHRRLDRGHDHHDGDGIAPFSVFVEQTLGRIALVQDLAQFADHAARQIEQQDRRVARQRIQ